MSLRTAKGLKHLGFFCVFTLSGCGGGTPQQPITVSVSPQSAKLPAGTNQTTQFTAVVANDSSNRGVSWSIAGCSGGASLCGAISPVNTASGAPATYTAPPMPPNPVALTIVATSVTDGKKSSSATLTITPRISVSVAPQSGPVPANTVQQFAATVTNDPNNRGVTWSLTGTGCNGGPCGRLSNVMDDPVTYGAPDHVPSPATETLTATAVADNTASASVTITITGTIVISVFPASLTIALGDTRQFGAGLLNDFSNQGVSWRVSGCPAGMNCGTFSPATTLNGVPTNYTAPASIAQDVNATITATSIADPTRTGTAALLISTTAKPISIALTPPSASVEVGGAQPFDVVVSNDPSASGVTWSITGCAGGSSACGVMATGSTGSVYAAPSRPALAQTSSVVTATSIADTGKSASALVTILPAALNFSTQSYPAGTAPAAVARADFNGDGKLDAVVADSGNTSTNDPGGLSVFLGNGDGTFQPAIPVNAGKNPVSVVVGDFNGDGNGDIVVADAGDRPNGFISVLLGNGDGNFQAPIATSVGHAPFNLSVGDFDGDGKLDVAVSDFGNVAPGDFGAAYILLGKGDGTFVAAVPVSAGENPVSLVSADFNGDGKLDLAVADEHDPSTIDHGGVSILLGNGDGTFQAPRFFGISLFPTSVFAGDLNGDGSPDLVLSGFIGIFGLSSNVLNVMLGDGAGNFTLHSFLLDKTKGSASAIFPLSVAIGDFDDDGKVDVTEINGKSVSILSGNGDGTFQGQLLGGFFQGLLSFFQGQLFFTAGTDPFALCVGDFNGDGKPDIAVANFASDDVSILLNRTP